MFATSSFSPESGLDNLSLSLYQNGLTCQVETGCGVNLVISYGKNMYDIIDEDRLRITTEMTARAVLDQLRTHYDLAMSGAMRWHYNLRPEVMIDCTGRML